MAWKHLIETHKVKGLHPNSGPVTLKETNVVLSDYLDQKASEGWEVVSVGSIECLQVVLTFRRQG